MKPYHHPHRKLIFRVKATVMKSFGRNQILLTWTFWTHYVNIISSRTFVWRNALRRLNSISSFFRIPDFIVVFFQLLCNLGFHRSWGFLRCYKTPVSLFSNKINLLFIHGLPLAPLPPPPLALPLRPFLSTTSGGSGVGGLTG